MVDAREGISEEYEEKKEESTWQIRVGDGREGGVPKGEERERETITQKDRERERGR